MVRLEGLKSVNALVGDNTQKDSKGKLRINAGKLLLAYLTGGSSSGTEAVATEATLGEQVAAAESVYTAPTQLTQASALSETLQQLGKYKEMIQQGPQSLLGSLLQSGANATNSGGIVNDTLNETFKLLKAGIENYTPQQKRRR